MSESDIWWKRANLVLQVVMGVYLLYLVLPEGAKVTVRERVFHVTSLERSLRRRRADLEDFRRHVMFDIHCLPEVAEP